MSQAIEDIFSDTDLVTADEVSFGGSDISAGVAYLETLDEKDRDSIHPVLQLTVKRSDVTGIDYRSPVTVASETWYFWKERKGSLYTRVLWFRKDERVRRRF